METYPGSSLFSQEKDRFANPVGYTISREIEVLYEELVDGMNFDKLSASLDNIIKIRAVQDFSPSQAIAFIFLLKKAVKEELADEIGGNWWLKFESRIDKLALLAFDIYMKCREKIYQIKVNKVKAETERALKLSKVME
ncbi:RsbRD N-terminal domain-containing protein [Dehalococcoidales bacterium]|nr:RsbRD N-terminal domain-containing protein [Dehalococcoidales bacterium]